MRTHYSTLGTVLVPPESRGAGNGRAGVLRARNPYLEAYVLGIEEESDVSPGEEQLDETAMECFSRIGRAWEAHPMALKWLEDQTP